VWWLKYFVSNGTLDWSIGYCVNSFFIIAYFNRVNRNIRITLKIIIMKKELSSMSAKEIIELYIKQEGWIETVNKLPCVGSSVEISDDGINVIETAKYLNKRTCMFAGVGGRNGYFRKGFATVTSTGCYTGLILDTPKYWRLL
jgi:hypothetical protein